MSERFPSPALAVVKVGSSSLRRDDGLLDRGVVKGLAEQLATVRAQGTRVVLVSSGAVAAGMGLLGLDTRPEDLQLLQTCAAVGQATLINAYHEVLASRGLVAAQLLLTQDDFVGRGRYLNARSTLRTLLGMEVVPIINENDAIAFDELVWGDNDHLAALVASMLHADLLVMLSDVDGLYDRDPMAADARLVSRVARPADVDATAIGGSGSTVGSGGMRTKVESARIVTASGGDVVVARASRPDVVLDAVAGRDVGTHFVAQPDRRDARRLWIGFALRPRGTLRVDEGAAHVLTQRGTSLLPVGVTAVEGDFERGSCVRILAPGDAVVGRGLVDYDSGELEALKGRRSGQDAAGTLRPAVHRDHLYVLRDGA